MPQLAAPYQTFPLLPGLYHAPHEDTGVGVEPGGGLESETCLGRPMLIQEPMFQVQNVPIRDRSEYPIVVVGDRDGPESVPQEKVRRFL